MYENIVKISELVHENRHITIRTTANEMGMSFGSFQSFVITRSEQVIDLAQNLQ
jgi:hypothetical protein